MVLQVDNSGHGHLHAAEHRHHLQDLIVKRRRREGLTDRRTITDQLITNVFTIKASHLYVFYLSTLIWISLSVLLYSVLQNLSQVWTGPFLLGGGVALLLMAPRRIDLWSG